MSERAKQECPHCGRSFTIGAGLSRHQRACQHKDHERAGEVIDLMALLQNSLAEARRKSAGLQSRSKESE